MLILTPVSDILALYDVILSPVGVTLVRVKVTVFIVRITPMVLWYGPLTTPESVIFNRSTGSRFTCLEPRWNRSQHKTNGALVHSNSSI